MKLTCASCGNQREREGCLHCSDADPLPDDYESCGECGFDHAYEPQQATRYHKKEDKKMNKVEQLLQQLGDTAEEVAQHLRYHGIKGRPCQPGTCPISRYLRANGVYEATTGTRDAGGKVGDYSISSNLPPAVKAFVALFDHDHFPELKE